MVPSDGVCDLSSKERANRRVPDVDLEVSLQGNTNEGFDGHSVQTEQQNVSIHRSGKGSATGHMENRSQLGQSPPPRFAMLTPTLGTGADLRHYQPKPLSFYEMPLPEVVNPKRAPGVGGGGVGLGFARRVGSTGPAGDLEQISSWDTAGLPATPLMVDLTAST